MSEPIRYAHSVWQRTGKEVTAKKERTEWHRCQAWGRTGEVIQQYCRKGGQVCVEGRLQTRSWEDRDGNKRYTTEVVVLQVYLIGGGGQQQDRAPVPCDDEIPF